MQPAPLSTRLHRVTAGNPLALLELRDQLDHLDALPPSAHWLYFLETPIHSQLAVDGPAKKGGLLPPVPLRVVVGAVLVSRDGRNIDKRLFAVRGSILAMFGWVLGLTILVKRALIGGEEPGMDPTRTVLHEEGCGELTVPDILEAFSRHFLLWVSRFGEEGLRPVAAHWLERGSGYKESVALSYAGEQHAGIFTGLDDSGGMLLQTETVEALPLSAVLAGPSWVL